MYAGRANFKSYDLPRAEGGMYAGRANTGQPSEVLQGPNASQEITNSGDIVPTMSSPTSISRVLESDSPTSDDCDEKADGVGISGAYSRGPCNTESSSSLAAASRPGKKAQYMRSRLYGVFPLVEILRSAMGTVEQSIRAGFPHHRMAASTLEIIP
jgi:hypothetical protein